MKPDLILWQSFNVTRWHANPDIRLRNSGDTVGSHVARVCALHQMLFGNDTGLIGALWHDAAEIVTGDLPYGSPIDKSDAEAEFCKRYSILIIEYTSVKLCDRLDAYLWMLAVAPDLRHKPEWLDALACINSIAAELRVGDAVHKLITEAGQ